MSEAELHVLRARLRGGVLHKASRAALKLPLPVGLAYTDDDTVVLDPDAQIQHALRLLFATFQRTGSAWATVKYFRAQGLLFPRRIRTGPHAGTIHWMALGTMPCGRALRNPRYAGAFCYGRTHTTKHPDGSLHIQSLPQEQWLFLLRDAHVGYLSWEEYEANRQQLRANAQASGQDRRHGPPREGPALLQGLLLCGRCGNRMTVRYHCRGTRLIPEYLCQKKLLKRAATPCVSRCWETAWMARLPISCSPALRRWQWRPASRSMTSCMLRLTPTSACGAAGGTRPLRRRTGATPLPAGHVVGTNVFSPLRFCVTLPLRRDATRRYQQRARRWSPADSLPLDATERVEFSSDSVISHPELLEENP